jgi:hypothetical protein
MTLDDIHAEWAADARIEEDELADESRKIPQLHSKYFKMYSTERLRLKSLDFQYKVLYKLKYEYFSGTIADEDMMEQGWQPNPLKILRADVQTYIDADADVIALLQKKAMQQEKVDTIDSIIKSINTRGFQIKNAIDWIRFTNGG